MKGLIGTLIFFIIAPHVQGAPKSFNGGYHPGYSGNPSNYLRQQPGYGGNPSNHLRPWGYSGPASIHTKPMLPSFQHGMSWGQRISSAGTVMVDSEGNYQPNDMGQFGSVSYPSSGNVQVLSRNEMYSDHAGGHYPSSGNVQVLPSNNLNIGYSGSPSNHLRPWGNPGYGGNPSEHLRPWHGQTKVEVMPVSGALPPVHQAPIPPMIMSQPPMSISQVPMSISQPPMSIYRPPMGMFQPLNNWRKSYQPIPGSGNCYNRCRNRCGYPQYSGCRPTCTNRCNIRPTCAGRMGTLTQPGNFQVSGNTLLCGPRRQTLQPGSPWIPGYPTPNIPTYSQAQTLPYSQAETLPYPIKLADVPEDVEGSGDEITDENTDE